MQWLCNEFETRKCPKIGFNKVRCWLSKIAEIKFGYFCGTTASLIYDKWRAGPIWSKMESNKEFQIHLQLTGVKLKTQSQFESFSVFWRQFKIGQKKSDHSD
jgi:hypothetical protein